MPEKISLLIILFLVSAQSFASGEAELFFKRYIELSDNFDPQVANLYSDSAKIHTYRVYPHGKELAMTLSGSQWKQLVAQVMPLAKRKGDKSKYNNIKVTKFENGYKIKADRYSSIKCYTDSGYYMVIEPDKKGNYVIIEEYSETQPQSNC